MVVLLLIVVLVLAGSAIGSSVTGSDCSSGSLLDEFFSPSSSDQSQSDQSSSLFQSNLPDSGDTVSQNNLDISSQQKTGTGVLSYQQVAQLAVDAGFSGQDLVTAIAVCTAESGRNPDALNSNGTVAPREGSATDIFSVGLMQINLSAHHEYEGVNLFDPSTNMRAAFEIYSSERNTFQPWGGFTSGNYAKYLQSATSAVA